jgi:hypothetical protein
MLPTGECASLVIGAGAITSQPSRDRVAGVLIPMEGNEGMWLG